jgi:PAS domain S-box-containing protein
MKLQTKIAFLIGSIALVFFIILFLIQYTENQKTQEILVERKIEKLKSFKSTLQSIEKTLEVFAKDYTQWDEMVNFISSKDPAWAYDNIDYSLNTYKANAAWLFDTDFEKVYSANNLNQNTLNKFPLDKNKIKKILISQKFPHFFIVIKDELVEVRGAPIQPSNDLERKTKPSGYFLAGRVWSEELLKEISLQTSSNVKLKKDFSEDVKNEDKFKVTVFEKLLDWNEDPIVTIVSISDFSVLKKSAEVFNFQMILFFVFAILVLGSVSLFLIINVSAPLKIIYKGLEEQNPALLVKHSKSKSEFGKLSELIIQFFSQKEQLIDETQQRRFVETSLSKSEEKYKKIFDNVQDVFYQTDINGNIISISPSIERYSEYTPDEVIGRKITDFYLDPGVRDKLLSEIYKNGEVVDFEIMFVKKSGKTIPCSVNSHFLFNDERKVVGLEGSLRDISERKKNEEKILKLSRAIDQSPTSVVITDVGGNIEYVNPKFIDTSGFTLEEVIGKKVNLLKSGLMPNSIYKDLWRTISAGNEWYGELQNRKKSGELYWEWVLISPIKNQNNIITNYLAIKEDITEKKKIIEELKTAKEKAEEMSNIKSSFLANMSHELRTPMMGILGNAEIISISTEDEEIKDMASAIYTSGRRLINTLNLILDLSRIEANKEGIDIEKLEVVSIINEVTEHFSSAAKQKNLSLNFNSDVEILYSSLDERLFREVLNNLINNAIKFTNIGGITISLTAEAEKMIIKVYDTGIGIPLHNLGLIFEEFRQVSEGYGRSFEGTGLGLTITKKFVEKLGGKISVKSVIDEGSEFTIEFPILKD